MVRGVAGRRHEYRPVESCLAADARPESIGRALRERLQLSEAYVADLDAIAGAEPAWEIYRQLADCGLALHIDAGLATLERARALAQFRVRDEPLAGVIAGLETSPGPESLSEWLEIVGPDRLIFSVDLKDGAPLAGSSDWRSFGAEAIVREAWRRGVRRFIVLDLARVGTFQGIGGENLIRFVRRLDPQIEIISGGGVRNQQDLDALAAIGCDAALVASALHDGRLSGQMRADG